MNMTEYLIYTSKVNKQHNSIVCVIPYSVRKLLRIDPGDLVSFIVKQDDFTVEFKVVLKGVIGRARD